MRNHDEDLLPIRSEERYAELPISVSTLYKLISTGELPAVKIGRKTFLRRGDVRRYKADLPHFAHS